MNEKDLNRTINQLGRIRKSIVLDYEDVKKIESIRKKLFDKKRKNN